MKLVEPIDGWGNITPRRWQIECLPKLFAHYSQERPLNGIVRAIMGSGKAIAIAQLCAMCQLEPNEVIVVSTSSIYLVQDLQDAIRNRLDDDVFFESSKVGAYYTHGKDLITPVIVTCLPSVPELAEKLAIHRKKVVLWIADESHKTQTKAILAAHDVLMPERVSGWTATPFRTDKKESLSLFDKLLYDLGPAEAIRDGIVVPWQIVGWDGGETSLDDATYQMIKDSEGPGVVNAFTIQDAVDYAQFLNDKGFPALPVHSKMRLSDIKAALDDLRDGKIRCVVHCSLLQEGVNLPFLRWIALRRTVASRTRFIQEIGRVLRTWTDPVTGYVKTEAIVYDPNDLMSIFRLTYPEVLGGDGIIVGEEEEGKVLERQLTQEVFELMRAATDAKSGKSALSIAPLASYLSQLVSIFDVHGLIDRKISSRDWRSQAASDRQRTALNQMRYATQKKFVPTIHQKALGILTEFGGSLNKGMASDLISLEISLAEKKQWPNFKNLDKSANDGIDKHEKRKINPVAPPPPKGMVRSKPIPKVEQGLLFPLKREGQQ